MVGQLKRVSQQPHSVIARRPHAAGLKVAHRALAQFGACCQLFLRQVGPMPPRSQECAK